MTSPSLRLGAAVLLVAFPLVSQSPAPDRLRLRYAEFDPGSDEPAVSPALRGGADTALWIVQLAGVPREATREAMRAAGAQVHGYLPDNAHVVRMPVGVAAWVRNMRDVRWVGYYHPAYRLEPRLIVEQRDGTLPVRRYNIVVVDKHRDKPGLIAKIRGVGGRVDHEQPGSLLVEATLTPAQLIRVARMDEVLWIDRWTPAELDMNNARIQGGGNHVESVGGYTGLGIKGHVYEGIEANHQDFTNPGINVQSCGSAQNHGHCTAGIIFGNGTSHPDARGMAPDAQPYYTTYTCVSSGFSRWQVVQEMVGQNEVMFTSASWGGTRTRAYTSTSADTDDIIFDHDMPWTQSQSNAGNQDSRPQAWAKNIFSIGGVNHADNSDPTDDSWQRGGASTGPAADGRIKPDLCAYYEAIHCSDLTGSAGYSGGNSYTSFGGTSGATPIVAGHNALAIQMFTDAVFGNALRVPGGSRFQNRPHFSTLKALQMANAVQYPFTAASSDNRREHQGWGFPSLRSMWDNRAVHFIVDETDVLTQGNGTRWSVTVAAGRTELKVSMTYADPAGNPAAALTRINDLSLRVISPSGVQYFGNGGLEQGNYSTPGGGANNYDTVENVFISKPEAGTWLVDVVAPLIAQDSHVETPEVDADYGLVVNGAVLSGQTSIKTGTFLAFGSGCPGSVRTVGRGCITSNESGLSFFIPNLSTNTGYALQATAPSAQSIAGFDIYTDSPSGQQTITTGLYDADASGQPGSLIATGAMTVGTSTTWYTTTFATAAPLAAGERFFLFFMTGANPIQSSTTLIFGSSVPHYTRSGTSGSWSSPQSGQWRYRVHCLGNRLRPLLASGEIPAVGTVYNVTLSQTVPNVGAALIIGGSSSTWALGSLPFSLEPLQATGCSLLVSIDVLLGGLTDGQGNLSIPIQVPNDPSLIDGEVFHQYFVLDALANPFGAVLTNGGKAVIGQ